MSVHTNDEKREARTQKLTLEFQAARSGTERARQRAQRIRTELVELWKAHARHFPPATSAWQQRPSLLQRSGQSGTLGHYATARTALERRLGRSELGNERAGVAVFFERDVLPVPHCDSVRPTVVVRISGRLYDSRHD